MGVVIKNEEFQHMRSMMIQKQSLPYEAKVIMAEQRVREFEDWAAENGKQTQ